MLRAFRLAISLIVLVNFSVLPAQAAELTTCGSGSQANRLDPPLNPTGELGEGMSFGTTSITGFKPSKFDKTTGYATWDKWESKAVGGLETYYLYASSDGGVTWSCARSYALSAKVGGLVPNLEIQMIVLAQKGDTWGKSEVKIVAPINPSSKICPPQTYDFNIVYNEVLKGYFLVMYPHRTSIDPESENFAGKDQRAQSIKYTFEATIDNWKSKVIGKDSSGNKSFFLGQGIWIKPLDPKKPHTFRAIPTSSELDPVDTSGCAPFTKTLLPKALKADPCAASVLSPDCKQEVVVGENAGDEGQPQPATATTVKSIKCQKGKLSKRVKGVNPKCPPGYKLKK